MHLYTDSDFEWDKYTKEGYPEDGHRTVDCDIFFFKKKRLIGLDLNDLVFLES